MDYEKKYKEALKVAQKLYQDCPNGKNDRLYHTTDLEKMFPELKVKESEDERIRKELIEYVKDQQSSFISAPDCRDKYEEEENNKYNAWIAWLEKQGEQKQMKIPEESLGIDSETYNKIVDECIYGDDKQKPVWSEQDREMIDETLYFIREYQQSNRCKDENGMQNSVTCEKWLKSLKQRIGG